MPAGKDFFYQSGAGGGLPSGVVLPYGGASAPAGYLLCDGSAVSRTTYAALFAAISTTFGAGDGSTTFALPDMRGRVPAGRDNMGGSAANRLTSTVMTADGNTVGATGGTQTHTLTTAQLPAHNHDVNGFATGANTGVGASDFAPGGTVQGQTANAGSGSAHLNTQPTIILNYIIKI